MAEVDDARGERTTNSNLLPARDALRVIAHIDMDAFYAQIEQVGGGLANRGSVRAVENGSVILAGEGLGVPYSIM